MAQPTQQEIDRELARINPLIEDLMGQIKELKAKIAEAKSEGRTDQKREFANQLDKLEAQKNALKTDRYALWATEKDLKALAEKQGS